MPNSQKYGLEKKMINVNTSRRSIQMEMRKEKRLS